MTRVAFLVALCALSLTAAGARDPYEARVSIQRMLDQVLKKMDAGIAHAKGEYKTTKDLETKAVLQKIAAAEAHMKAEMAPVEQGITSQRDSTNKAIDGLENNVNSYNKANISVSLTRIKARAMEKRLGQSEEEIRRIKEVHASIATLDRSFADASSALLKGAHERLARSQAQVAEDAAGRRAELTNFQDVRKRVFQLTQVWREKKMREAERVTQKEEMRKQRELDLAKTNLDLAKAKAEHEVSAEGSKKAETVALKKEVSADRKELKQMRDAQLKMATEMQAMKAANARKAEQVAAEREALAARKDRIEDEANAVRVEKAKAVAQQMAAEKLQKTVDAKATVVNKEASAEAVISELKL